MYLFLHSNLLFHISCHFLHNIICFDGKRLVFFSLEYCVILQGQLVDDSPFSLPPPVVVTSLSMTPPWWKLCWSGPPLWILCILACYCVNVEARVYLIHISVADLCSESTSSSSHCLLPFKRSFFLTTSEVCRIDAHSLGLLCWGYILNIKGHLCCQ